MTHGVEHLGEESLGGRREDVELYARTYSTVLRTSGEVRLRAFERAHANVWPSLHGGASRPEPDTGALIYAVNRLPAVAGGVGRVILGQLPEHFAQALGRPLDDWQAVQAPARRRQWHYDGRSTLAVHFRRLPVDVGLVHYASDTPYTRARTLGSRSLSFEGVDSTYASAVAILRRILR